MYQRSPPRGWRGQRRRRAAMANTAESRPSQIAEVDGVLSERDVSRPIQQLSREIAVQLFERTVFVQDRDLVGGVRHDVVSRTLLVETKSVGEPQVPRMLRGSGRVDRHGASPVDLEHLVSAAIAGVDLTRFAARYQNAPGDEGKALRVVHAFAEKVSVLGIASNHCRASAGLRSFERARTEYSADRTIVTQENRMMLCPPCHPDFHNSGPHE